MCRAHTVPTAPQGGARPGEQGIEGRMRTSSSLSIICIEAKIFPDTGCLLACHYHDTAKVRISHSNSCTENARTFLPISHPVSCTCASSDVPGLQCYLHLDQVNWLLPGDAVVFAEPSLSVELRSSRIRTHPESPVLAVTRS